jgi:hypothetical protein
MPPAEADSYRGKKAANERRRQEKRRAKEARVALRRVERVDPYHGHESQFDPAMPAGHRPPPMLGRAVRSPQIIRPAQPLA